MRLALVLLAAALVLAAPAGSGTKADPPAELFVYPLDTMPGAAAETDVDLSVPETSNLTIATVTVGVPAGYTVDLAAPPGTAIGNATVFLAGRPDPSSTGLFTADAAAFTADPCSPGAHAAVWTAALDAFPLTIFVDPTSVDDPLGAYTLVYCLPVPVGTRAVDVDLDLRNVLSNPVTAGLATWRVFVTPSGGDAFEVRSLVALPQTLTVRPSFGARRNEVALTGRLLAAGKPRPRVNVHVAVATRADLSDARELGVARTRADGSYSLRSPFARTRASQRLILIAYVNFYVADCAGPPLLPGDCAEESIAPPPAQLASLTIPRR